MKITNKFIMNNLKLNKKRTILILIAIILSTALICSISTIASSLRKTFLNNSIDNIGNYHATIYNISKEKQDIILENDNIESHFMTQGIGYSKLENSLGRQYLYLMGFDQKALQNYGLKLKSGNLPKNDSEIIISEQININGNLDYKIGDKLKLDLINIKLSENEYLNQDIFVPKDTLLSDNLVKEELYEKEYTIVGIIERPNLQIEPYTSSGYTVITLESNLIKIGNFSVKYYNINSAEKITEEISKNNDVKGIIEYKTFINVDLLRWSGALKLDFTTIIFVILIVIIMSIIVTTSIIVITSSFYISNNDKLKYYSIFFTLGATKGQIKKIILSEALILGIVGIPIGLALGILASYSMIDVMSKYFTSMYSIGEFDFTYDISLFSIITCIIISSLTIYFSSLGSAKRTIKLSLIETIKGNKSIVINKNSIKSSLFFKKLFGIEGVIAYKNLKINKKQYKTTIISLVISISIFISLSSFTNYSYKIAKEYYDESSFNITANYITQETEEEKFKEFVKISMDETVERYNLFRTIEMITDISDKLNNAEDYRKGSIVKGNELIRLYSIGDQEYRNYLEKIGRNYEECKNGAIWISNSNTGVYNEETKKRNPVLNINVGDRLYGINSISKEKVSVEILVITDKTPMGLENSQSLLGYFIISDEFLEKSGKFETSSLYIQSSNPDSLFNKIESSNEKLFVSNSNQEQIQNKRMISTISIFLYSFITIITLIGITNIFNTINIVMKLRAREFAVLKSIGMTKKSFIKMICLESIFYSIKALFIGVIIGIILSIIMYLLINQIMNIAFTISIFSIITSILAVLIIITIIMISSVRETRKQNIIETIRKEYT